MLIIITQYKKTYTKRKLKNVFKKMLSESKSFNSYNYITTEFVLCVDGDSIDSVDLDYKWSEMPFFSFQT